MTADPIILKGYQSAHDGVWHLWYEVNGSLLRLCDGLDPRRALPPTDGPNCGECVALYAGSFTLDGARLDIVLSGERESHV